jgi:hypothetical protein
MGALVGAVVLVAALSWAADAVVLVAALSWAADDGPLQIEPDRPDGVSADRVHGHTKRPCHS